MLITNGRLQRLARRQPPNIPPPPRATPLRDQGLGGPPPHKAPYVPPPHKAPYVPPPHKAPYVPPPHKAPYVPPPHKAPYVPPPHKAPYVPPPIIRPCAAGRAGWLPPAPTI